MAQKKTNGRMELKNKEEELLEKINELKRENEGEFLSVSQITLTKPLKKWIQWAIEDFQSVCCMFEAASIETKKS